jgi:hypothetical protein
MIKTEEVRETWHSVTSPVSHARRNAEFQLWGVINQNYPMKIGTSDHADRFVSDHRSRPAAS